MIHLEHRGNKILGSIYNGLSCIEGMKRCAFDNPSEFLLFSKEGINVAPFVKRIENDNRKAVFISSHNTLNKDLGYIEDSPFIKISKNVRYPTWIKGSEIVYIHASIINLIANRVPEDSGYLYWLNSIGKLTSPQGVFTYQFPEIKSEEKLSTTDLYKFVKQHYRARWTLLLLICHLLYERRFPFYSFAKAQFYSKVNCDIDMRELHKNDLSTIMDNGSYDVIIPTMGRATYLHDVLKDFAEQTQLPQKVIIVEQNPEPKSITALDFITIDTWPFKIEHIFIHQTGACNARNIALAQTTSEWVFFADDDIRFAPTVLKEAIMKSTQLGVKCIALSCLQKEEIDPFKIIHQWSSFPSGASIVQGKLARKLKFNTAYEHGYGEDAEYGMQLRNVGTDILYCPDIELLHLKAPVGGFRHKVAQPWEREDLAPKPSPSIMLFRLMNTSKAQLKGYKLVLFFKFYGSLS